VRLTPNSARDEIAGSSKISVGRSVLHVRVRALPHDGAANDALVKLLAKATHIPPRAVRLEFGATSRIKVLRLKGDTAELEEYLRSAAKDEP
jgi:uncharacterized protein YggU (UPF0235/DUF167 family)